MNLSQITTDPKIAGLVGGGAVAASIGEILQWIPDAIGKLGALLGSVLSAVLIVTHTIAAVQRYRKSKLEIRALQKANSPTEHPPGS
jgi:hypothetical protein